MKKTFLSFFFLPVLAFSQIPAGYYDEVQGLQGYALKSKLHEIVSKGAKSFNYDDLTVLFQQTDKDIYYENNGSLLDIYSEIPSGADAYEYDFTQIIGSASAEGQGWNREHGVPQSTYYGIYPMYSDLNYLIPTDARINQRRSNFPYARNNGSTLVFSNGSKLGKSTTSGYTNSVYEPIDEFKGDVARFLLYYVVRYEGSLNIFNHMVPTSVFDGSEERGFKTWYINMLLDWHQLDPVSQKEIDRNNTVYSIQNTRNPFIDHPEYISLIWSDTGDGTAPQNPQNLSASETGKNYVKLQWQASSSSDVLGYKIYLNGAEIGYSKTNSFISDRLSPSTSYQYTVKAYDKDFLLSPDSNVLQTTTLENDAYASDLMITKFIEGSGNNTAIEITNKTGHEVVLNNYYLSAQFRNETYNNWYFDGAYQLQGTILPGESIVVINPKSNFPDYDTSSADYVSGANALSVSGTQYVELSYGKKYIITASTNNYDMGYSTVDAVGFKDTYNTNANTSLYRNQDVNQPNTAFTISEWTSYPMDYTVGLGEDVLAVDETFTAKEKYTIYPNPVVGETLYIKGKSLESVAKAEIYDYSGRLMKSEIQPFRSGNSVDVSSLKPGVYLLKIDNQTLRFIKK
ncbi:MAG: endonuclease [Bergeyella sp.]